MRNRIAIFAAVLVGILILSAAYQVEETEQVVITYFGEVHETVTDPGLHFKIPVFQAVSELPKMLLQWDGAPENMTTGDKKNIFVDTWAKWRIVDPMKYFMAVRTVDAGQKVLDDRIDSSVRAIVAANNLIEVVRMNNDPLLSADNGNADAGRAQRVEKGRTELAGAVLAAIKAKGLVEEYGIEVTDMEFKRVNYVKTVREKVYERMISERTRIANLFASEASEQADLILGDMQIELDDIRGDWEQQSAKIRGDADAAVIQIWNDAVTQGAEFYQFTRQLEAMQKTLKPGSRVLLSTDSDFLSLLQGSGSKGE